MTNSIYPPREDTFFLLKHALSEIQKGDEVLEIGVGSGFISSKIQDQKEDVRVYGTDISNNATESSYKSGVRVLRCNLANGFSSGLFDVVIFNLPYLDNNQRNELNIDETALSYRDNLFSDFVEDAIRVLKSNGTVIYLLSDLTPEHEHKAVISNEELEIKRRETKSLFFENLELEVLG